VTAAVSLHLTVHRGTQEIGGSCIEVSHPDGSRLILDPGRPLDAPEGATGLLPTSLDRTRPATVLISHPHQDHRGLVEEIPASWPIWTGAGSAKLIAVTGDVTRRPLTRAFKTWDSRSGPLLIGPFTVTPTCSRRPRPRSNTKTASAMWCDAIRPAPRNWRPHGRTN